MSPTIHHKYKYFHSTVQWAKDRQQKFHFCCLPFDIRTHNVKLNLSISQQMTSKWILLKSRFFACTSTCNSDLSWSRLVISTASWQFSIALKRQLVALSFNIDWTSPYSNINSSLWHAPTFAFSTNRWGKFNKW